MRVIRKQLAPLAAYAFPTRYDEETNTVEVSYDGGTTWEPFPEGDPRLNNHTPPPDTSDPRCDAAARIRAATEDEANALIEQVDTQATLMPIVTGFLRLFTPLFTIIPYLGLAYTLIQAILSIGSIALHAAFDTFDWDEFECLLYKNIGAGGQFSDAGFEALLADIAATYSDATETLLYNFYYLAGRAGLNDQAGIRTETGDCSACPAGWSHTLYADSPELQWWFPYQWNLTCSRTSDGWYGKHGATEDNGAGHLRWIDTPRTSTAYWLGLAGQINVPDGCTITSVVWNAQQVAGANLDAWAKWRMFANAAQCWGAFYAGFNTWSGSLVGPTVVNWELNWWNNSANGYRLRINSITFEGTGVDPFV